VKRAGGSNETSPPKFSASGRRRCHAAGHVSDCRSPSLSDAAGALDHRSFPRRKLSFNLSRDIVPVAGIVRYPNVMEVNPSVPAKTVLEFIAYAKANPAKLTMASAGTGTTSHVAGELFKMMSSVNMVHVPYRGSAPALTDLLGGQVKVMFDAVPSSIEHIRAGKLRALAVTPATRSDVLPDVPTVADFLPGYESSVWFGVSAPNRLPTLARLSRTKLRNGARW
jgi:tripartite-type tricarboxylate transporter receptor subunit TctC